MPKKPRDASSPRYKARMGYEGEYYLIQKFAIEGKPGTYAVRTPGSGAGKLPKPDIIAVDGGELLAIEVKSSNKPYVALNSLQVNRLLDFCKFFVVRCPHCGAEIRPKPILAARFLGKEWRFIEIPMDWKGSIILKRTSPTSASGELPSQSPGDGEESSR
ncbi:MAG: hypothetical protein N3F65_03510 [Nitrososphaeria archaeon]|nr:hypothetical protein [Aigarchaeota archaeon]MCX8187658.1 hypothetical protein [Nitrososphaeria archaeon]MDW8021553.1 hypothetical protein [Nitrososphaerota archaeon]